MSESCGRRLPTFGGSVLDKSGGSGCRLAGDDKYSRFQCPRRGCEELTHANEAASADEGVTKDRYQQVIDRRFGFVERENDEPPSRLEIGVTRERHLDLVEMKALERQKYMPDSFRASLSPALSGLRQTMRTGGSDW